MFMVRLCVEDDIEPVDKFLSTVVFKEEPLISINGPHVIPPTEESISAAVIPQGHSTVALSPDGQVIGVCLNEEPPQIWSSIYTNSQDDIKFQEFFKYMKDTSGIDDVAPNALEVRMIAVAKEWRKKGVAYSLIRATELAAYNARLPYLKIYCTSIYSSLLLKKLGWNKLYSLGYKEYIETYKPGLKIPTYPHTHSDIYYKQVIF